MEGAFKGAVILHWAPKANAAQSGIPGAATGKVFCCSTLKCEVKNHALSIPPVPMPGLPLSPAGRAIAGSHPLLRRVSQQTEAKTVPQVRAYLSERLVSQVDFAANLPRL